MSCLVSCALLTVLALWVSTTPANCPANAIAAAHVHVFLFRAASILVGLLVGSS
jgi:hypothetical protein